MMSASPAHYLTDLVAELQTQWPNNRTVNIVCHGHSVPSGYFATPFVDTFNAYPHLLHRALKDRFPFAVINVIVSARGGESSDEGAIRFERDVLDHHPDVIFIDYVLNDRRIGLYSAEKAHRSMIERALDEEIKVVLMSHTPDLRVMGNESETRKLAAFDAQLSSLAQEYGIAYQDVPSLFDVTDQLLGDYMSWPNHPNAQGHALIARALLRWFPL
ncbi:hypothetical protein IAD21_03012 [Abditibacteriota bacterium]|nr:hypothetical protein IAD21_03012 [Abditibacteriota bacterium]